MAVDWYVQHQRKTRGPLTPAQLKALATTSQLTERTLVRKGQQGQWVAAARVKGLFPAETPETKPSANASGITEDGTTHLQPKRRRWPRFITVAVLATFISIGGAPLHQQAFFVISMALILGSFPKVIVRQRHLERTLIVLFLPVHTQRWPLRDFTGVETDCEPRVAAQFGILIWPILGLLAIFRLLDRFVPWLGGDYRLWLRTYDDRLLVWQGNNESHFEANRELIEDATKLSAL